MWVDIFTDFQLIYLFICDSFNNVTSFSEYVASNGRMINER
jgi:hypothetical protein